MLHVPVSEAPKWSLVTLAPIISAFRILAFRDSCDEESRHLTLPTPGIRTSGMESLTFHNLAFRDFGFHDFGTPVVRVLDIPNSRYPKSSSFF
jgi:hypothetical protein